MCLAARSIVLTPLNFWQCGKWHHRRKGTEKRSLPRKSVFGKQWLADHNYIALRSRRSGTTPGSSWIELMRRSTLLMFPPWGVWARWRWQHQLHADDFKKNKDDTEALHLLAPGGKNGDANNDESSLCVRPWRNPGDVLKDGLHAPVYGSNRRASFPVSFPVSDNGNADRWAPH